MRSKTKPLVSADPQQAINWCRAATGLDFAIESNQPGRIELIHKCLDKLTVRGISNKLNHYLKCKPERVEKVGSSMNFFRWRLSSTCSIQLLIGFAVNTIYIYITLVDTGRPSDT